MTNSSPRPTFFRSAIVAIALVFAAGAIAPASAKLLPVPDKTLTDLKKQGLRDVTLTKALKAWKSSTPKIRNQRYLTIIDFGIHSSKPRLFMVDTKTGKGEALLVSHGQGSDPDHDGWADKFSNIEGSKMSSLGAYVTKGIYYGKHGMSLRLDGLEVTNNRALERLIVIHGANYVAKGRKVLGRSWGCPAIPMKDVKRLLPKLAGGSFLYIAR